MIESCTLCPVPHSSPVLACVGRETRSDITDDTTVHYGAPLKPAFGLSGTTPTQPSIHTGGAHIINRSMGAPYLGTAEMWDLHCYFIAEYSVGRMYTSSTLYSPFTFSMSGSAAFRYGKNAGSA